MGQSVSSTSPAAARSQDKASIHPGQSGGTSSSSAAQPPLPSSAESAVQLQDTAYQAALSKQYAEFAPSQQPPLRATGNRQTSEVGDTNNSRRSTSMFAVNSNSSQNQSVEGLADVAAWNTTTSSSAGRHAAATTSRSTLAMDWQRSASIPAELESVRRHASDPRVVIGLMRGVLSSARSNPLAAVKFVDWMLGLAPESPYVQLTHPPPLADTMSAVSPKKRGASLTPRARAQSVMMHPGTDDIITAGTATTSAGGASDDAYRHPIAMLVTRTIQSSSPALLEMSLAWVELIVTSTQLIAAQQTDGDCGGGGADDRGGESKLQRLPSSPSTMVSDDLVNDDDDMSIDDDDDEPAKAVETAAGRSPLLASAPATGSGLGASMLASSQPVDPCAAEPAAPGVALHPIAVDTLLRHGVVPLLHHVFALQDSKPVSGACSLNAARLLRYFSDTPAFIEACLDSPLPARCVRRLRFTRPGSEERACIVDYLYLLASHADSASLLLLSSSMSQRAAHHHLHHQSLPSSVTDPFGEVVAFQPGAVALTRSLSSQLPAFLDAVLTCVAAEEPSRAVVLRALRVIAAVSTAAITGFATPLPFTTARVLKLAPLWERGPVVHRDLCRVLCAILNSEEGRVTDTPTAAMTRSGSNAPTTTSGPQPGEQSNAGAPVVRGSTPPDGRISPVRAGDHHGGGGHHHLHRSDSSSAAGDHQQHRAVALRATAATAVCNEVALMLSQVFDVKLVERGNVHPVDLLHVMDVAMSNEIALSSLVLSRQMKSIVSRTSDAAIRVSRGTRHWLGMVKRMGGSETTSDVPVAFADSGGLDVLLGIVEAGVNRSSVYEAVAAIQRLCTTDSSRVRLLKQRNFHALLRTISPKGTGEQMLAASEAVSILRSMMSPSVLSRADSYLVEAIDSLLCQALSHCPLVNPRTHSVEATYIIASQSVLQTVLELLLRRARSAVPVCLSIYHQLPLDRLRELTTQSWYPVVQRTAKELLLTFVVSDDRLCVELLQYQLVNALEVTAALKAHEAAQRQVENERRARASAASSRDFTSQDSLAAASRRGDGDAAAGSDSDEEAEEDRSELKRDASAVRSLAVTRSLTVSALVERATITRVQRRWRLVLNLRRLSSVRVSAASLFKTAFLHHNQIIDREQQEFAKICGLFDSHVNYIDEQYKEREALEADASQRTTITGPEAAARCGIGLWFTEDVELLVRAELADAYLAELTALKQLEEVATRAIIEHDKIVQAESKAFEALEMRSTQSIRAVERLYDQRRHLEKTEQRFRGKIHDEVVEMRRAAAVRQRLLFTESDAAISRRRIHGQAVAAFIDIRLSFYPVLLKAVRDAEEAKRGEIEIAAAQVFGASSLHIKLLELQRVEEDVRAREVRWVKRAFDAIKRQYYALAARHLQLRERAVRARLWHAFCWQWFEVARPAATLRVQSDEDVGRRAIGREERVATGTILEALRACSGLALQATEVRARRALENVYALHCRYRAIDLHALRLAWVEQHARNHLVQQWYVGARNIVLPLSVLRLACHEEALLEAEIDRRATVWIAEWHAWEELKLDALQREQHVRRRAITAEHREQQDALLNAFVGSTHVLAIQHAASRGYRQSKATSSPARATTGGSNGRAAASSSPRRDRHATSTPHSLGLTPQHPV